MMPISLIKKEEIQVDSHGRLHTGKTKNIVKRKDDKKACDVHQQTLFKKLPPNSRRDLASTENLGKKTAPHQKATAVRDPSPKYRCRTTLHLIG